MTALQSRITGQHLPGAACRGVAVGECTGCRSGRRANIPSFACRYGLSLSLGRANSLFAVALAMPQDVDFLLRNCARLNRPLSRGISFLGAAGSRNPAPPGPAPGARACPSPGRRRPTRGSGVERFARQTTQGQAPFVGNHLQRRADVERAKLGVARNAQAHVAAVHVLIAHAKALQSQTGNPPAVWGADRPLKKNR